MTGSRRGAANDPRQSAEGQRCTQHREKLHERRCVYHHDHYHRRRRRRRRPGTNERVSRSIWDKVRRFCAPRFQDTKNRSARRAARCTFTLPPLPRALANRGFADSAFSVSTSSARGSPAVFDNPSPSSHFFAISFHIFAPPFIARHARSYRSRVHLVRKSGAASIHVETSRSREICDPVEHKSFARDL